MKKRVLAYLLAGLLALTACGVPTTGNDGGLHIVATTYPVYLLATAVTEGAEGVEVTLMLNQPTACLHDYTLTVTDMKALEQADVLVMSGGGLEDFMADALKQNKAAVIDCAQGIDLLPYEGHEGHDHGEEEGEHYDPHYWLDPGRAMEMVDNIAAGLDALASNDVYERNATAVKSALAGVERPVIAGELITFHDGFRYLADYLGLDILKAVEEEAGSEASAKEIVEITALVEAHQIPAIFTEVNGSEATANVVAWETGVEIYRLNMMMSGEGTGIQPYLDAMNANISTILEALG